jgi:hypothetical protein
MTDLLFVAVVCFLKKKKYVNKAASSVRGALKEPAKRKAMAQEAFSYKVSSWEQGVQSPKVKMGTGPPPKVEKKSM